MTHDFSRRSSRLVRWLPILAVLLALGASPGRARADSILYVSENNNTIQSFTPGGVGSTFASTGLSGPVGLAFDGSGNLYAANSNNNTIEKFTPGGVASTFATTTSSPRFLAFGPSAVPEPPSLVLMMLGSLGTIAGLARRRIAGSAKR
jgi:hypothetical protein